jgi:hypothetical protein
MEVQFHATSYAGMEIRMNGVQTNKFKRENPKKKQEQENIMRSSKNMHRDNDIFDFLCGRNRAQCRKDSA